MSKVLCLYGLNHKYCNHLAHYSSIMCSYVWPSRKDALSFYVQVMYPEKDNHDENEWLSLRENQQIISFPREFTEFGYTG